MRTNFQSEKEEAEKLYKMAKEEVDREQSALLKKMIEKQEHDIKLTKVIAFAECSLLVVLIVVFLVLIVVLLVKPTGLLGRKTTVKV